MLSIKRESQSKILVRTQRSEVNHSEMNQSNVEILIHRNARINHSAINQSNIETLIQKEGARIRD